MTILRFQRRYFKSVGGVQGSVTLYCDLRFTAVVMFDWVVFQLRKRKKYALLFLLDRFDCILQISHMLKYVLLKCEKFQSQFCHEGYSCTNTKISTVNYVVIKVSGLIALAAGSFYVIQKRKQKCQLLLFVIVKLSVAETNCEILFEGKAYDLVNLYRQRFCVIQGIMYLHAVI